MRYKILLMGRNNALIDDFYAQVEAGLDFLTCSLRYEDLLRHIELIKPAAVVYCLSRESVDDMNKMNSLIRRLERANTVLIVAGEMSDVEEFKQLAPHAAALLIQKPFTAVEVQKKIVQFLSGQTMNAQEMGNLKNRLYEQELQKVNAAQNDSGMSLLDELADLENELSEENLVPARAAAPAAAAEPTLNSPSIKSLITPIGASAPTQQPAAPAPQAKPAAAADDDDEEVIGPKKHILIIDDDPLMLKIIKDHLHKRYDVGSAISGKVAYKFLEKRHTDLILLDYVMPEENGPTVLRHLRESDTTRNIPVVFLTGMQERGKIAEALALKPQGYLLKPVDKKQLMTMVRNIIG